MFKKSNVAKTLAFVAACAGSGYLFAPPGGGSSVGTPTSSTASASTYGGYYAYHSVATAPSAVVTEASLMAIKVRKIQGLISAATAEAAESMNSGVGSNAAAMGGDAGVKLAGSSGSNHRASTWLRASYGAIDNGTTGQQWNGQSYLTILGADYKFNNMFCAGLGLSYSHLDARTEFNNGKMKQDTLGINPYFIIVPHKNFNVEFVGGWSTTKGNDSRRWVTSKKDATTAVYTSIDNTFTCSPKSKSLFGGVFANFVNKVNKTSFGLQLGYLMAQTKMDAFTEKSKDATYNNNATKVPSNTFKVQTAMAKALVGYQMTPSVMPFAYIHGSYDVKKNEGVRFDNAPAYKVNRSAFGGGGGFQVRNDDALSGSLQFDYTAQGQLKTYVTGLRLHYGF